MTRSKRSSTSGTNPSPQASAALSMATPASAAPQWTRRATSRCPSATGPEKSGRPPGSSASRRANSSSAPVPGSRPTTRTPGRRRSAASRMSSGLRAATTKPWRQRVRLITSMRLPGKRRRTASTLAWLDAPPDRCSPAMCTIPAASSSRARWLLAGIQVARASSDPSPTRCARLASRGAHPATRTLRSSCRMSRTGRTRAEWNPIPGADPEPAAWDGTPVRSVAGASSSPSEGASGRTPAPPSTTIASAAPVACAGRGWAVHPPPKRPTATREEGAGGEEGAAGRGGGRRTCSSVTGSRRKRSFTAQPNVSASRNASVVEGTWRPASIAMMAWRLTPTRSPRASCDRPRSRRYRRTVLWS